MSNDIEDVGDGESARPVPGYLRRAAAMRGDADDGEAHREGPPAAPTQGVRAPREGPVEEGEEGVGELPDARPGPRHERHPALGSRARAAGNLTKDEFERINRKARRILEKKKKKKKGRKR